MINSGRSIVAAIVRKTKTFCPQTGKVISRNGTMTRAILLVLISGFFLMLYQNCGDRGSYSLDISSSGDEASDDYISLSVSVLHKGVAGFVTVELTNPAAEDISIAWVIRSNESVNLEEKFAQTTGTVAVSKGAAHTSIEIVPIDDHVLEGMKTYELEVSDGSGRYRAASCSLNVYSTDAEASALSASTIYIREGTSGKLTISISQVAQVDLPVSWELQAEANVLSHFPEKSGTAVISAGFQSVQVTVSTTKDAEIQADRSVKVLLHSNHPVATEGYGSIILVDESVQLAKPLINVNNVQVIGEPVLFSFSDPNGCLTPNQTYRISYKPGVSSSNPNPEWVEVPNSITCLTAADQAGASVELKPFDTWMRYSLKVEVLQDQTVQTSNTAAFGVAGQIKEVKLFFSPEPNKVVLFFRDFTWVNTKYLIELRSDVAANSGAYSNLFEFTAVHDSYNDSSPQLKEQSLHLTPDHYYQIRISDKANPKRVAESVPVKYDLALSRPSGFQVAKCETAAHPETSAIFKADGSPVGLDLLYIHNEGLIDEHANFHGSSSGCWNLLTGRYRFWLVPANYPNSAFLSDELQFSLPWQQ